MRQALKANQAAARQRARVKDLKALIRQKRRDLERLVNDWLGKDPGDLTTEIIRGKAGQLEGEIKQHQAAITGLLATPLPGLSESNMCAVEAFAAHIRRGIELADPAEQRQVCRLLRLRGTVAEDRASGIKLARGRFTIDWEAALELRTGEDRLCNLHLLPTDQPFQLIGLPLKMVDTDGAPARVIAMLQ